MKPEMFTHKTNEAFAGVDASRAKSEVEKLRGEEVTKLDSAFGDTHFQALEIYGRDLVEEAEKLDPVIGRDEAISKVLSILLKRKNNNIVLIGEPGVGKTAVVEGFAQRIAKGNVPCLAYVKLIALDTRALVASAKYIGEFVERLKLAVLKEVEDAKGKVYIVEPRRWTGIPVTRLSQNEKEWLLELGDRLHNRVVRQDQAVNAIANLISK